MDVNIRDININDVEAFKHLIENVIDQSEYMLFNSGEHQLSIQNQTLYLENMITSLNSTILLAELNNKLIGYLIVKGGDRERTQHVAKLSMGLLPSFRNKGIGLKLLKETEEWAKTHNVHRLELTVVTENKTAYHLYEKFGFNNEGVLKDTLFFNDKYYDEYIMAKFIN